MNNGHSTEMTAENTIPDDLRAGQGQLSHSLHPAWRAFLRFCAELKHGDIERLKIQDGLPVLAEVTKKKVKFSS
jgi:hypothetical protein